MIFVLRLCQIHIKFASEKLAKIYWMILNFHENQYVIDTVYLMT